MSSVFHKNISQFKELQSKDGINNVKQYIKNQTLPSTYNSRNLLDFKKKYYDTGFVVRDNDLYYNPSSRVNLYVVPPEEREDKLQELYDDPEIGVGIGLNAFYQQVKRHYVGISQRFAHKFLKKQGDYQVQRPIRKAVNKKNIASVPNERWILDKFFMTAYFKRDLEQFNDKFLYVLTVVDVFSKKVFARPLKTGLILEVVKALDSILKETKTAPRILQGDNEFGAAEVKKWCFDNKVKLVLGSVYSAESSGLVEKMNAELRKKIRDGFVRNNNLEWVKPLQTYVRNINNQVPARGKYTPNELYEVGYNKPTKGSLEDIIIDDKSDLKDIRKATIRQYKKQGEAQLDRATKREKQSEYEVGDAVRISLKKLDDEIRKRYKTNIGVSYNAVRYTPEVFTVKRVFPQKNGIRKKYTLFDSSNKVVKKGNAHQLFFGNELILADKEENKPKVSSQKRAKMINLIDPYKDDDDDRTTPSVSSSLSKRRSSATTMRKNVTTQRKANKRVSSKSPQKTFQRNSTTQLSSPTVTRSGRRVKPSGKVSGSGLLFDKIPFVDV